MSMRAAAGCSSLSSTTVLGKRKAASVATAALVLRLPSQSESERIDSSSAEPTDNDLHRIPLNIPSSSKTLLTVSPAPSPPTKGGDGRYHCTFAACDKAYRKPSRLEEHIRSHTGEVSSMNDLSNLEDTWSDFSLLFCSGRLFVSPATSRTCARTTFRPTHGHTYPHPTSLLCVPTRNAGNSSGRRSICECMSRVCTKARRTSRCVLEHIRLKVFSEPLLSSPVLRRWV
jgi:hypothetical protein